MATTPAENDSVQPVVEAQESPLLNLPGELRDRIYEYAFDCAPDFITICKGAKNSTIGCTAPPLLQVCRQIREEASTIFYTQQKFYMNGRWYCSSDVAQAWLRSLDSTSRSVLRHLYFYGLPAGACAATEYMESTYARLVKEKIAVPKEALYALSSYSIEDGNFYNSYLHLKSGTDEPEFVSHPLEQITLKVECPHLCYHTVYRT
jgi:hypothetical protein